MIAAAIIDGVAAVLGIALAVERWCRDNLFNVLIDAGVGAALLANLQWRGKGLSSSRRKGRQTWQACRSLAWVLE